MAEPAECILMGGHRFALSRRSAIAGTGLAAALAGGGLRVHAAETDQPASSNGRPEAPFMPVMAELTAYIAGASEAHVPEAIRERARLHVLDTLASIIACHNLEAAKLGRRYALAISPGQGSPILASRQTASLVDAIFASAMTAHAAEINDFIPSAYVQPGPAIVSAALEVARHKNRSGRDLVSAVVAGYELAGRVPKAIGTRNLWKAGIANHGIGPVFGTATACASLLDLNTTQVNHMLAYCAQQASGSWQWMLDVGHVEKAFVFAGMGARNGVQAALMASLGFTGVPDSFDIEKTWFRWPAFTGNGADSSLLTANLGENFELSLSAMKRYPVGGPTQPAIRALLDLVKIVSHETVVDITVEMPGSAATFRSANMPALNIPYLAAIIMLDGHLDFTDAQSLERMQNDQAARAFAQKVKVLADEAQETGEGEDRTESARVTIRTTDGKSHSRFVAFVPGFPTHPLTRQEVEAKAHELVSPILGDGKSQELISRCAGLDHAQSVDPIIDILRFQSA